MKTKAAVLTQIDAPLEIMELDLPSLKKGQVLVQMIYSGLCHTQINEIRGLKGEDKFLPHTLGHEGTGIVLEVAEGVTKVRRDEAVVLSWIKGKGHDVPSTHYSISGKTVNSGAISTFLTHAIVSENRLTPLPKEMSLKEATLFGCALPTGAGVVRNEMNIQKEHSFALFGAGGIGLSALLAAKYMKAFPIIVIDIFRSKLDRARDLGATHLIHAIEEDPIKRILEITGGQGVDFAFESAGKRAAMEWAFASLRAPGGHAVLAGNLPQGDKIMIDPFDLIRGKKITGTWGGKSNIENDIAFYTDLFLKREISIGSLITHEFPLEKINELIREMEKGEVGRGILSISNQLNGVSIGNSKRCF